MRSRVFTIIVGICFPILSILLVIFFLASDVSNRELSFSLIEKVRDVKQYNTQLSKDVLRLQSGLISDYDSLVSSIHNVERTVDQIERDTLDLTQGHWFAITMHPSSDDLLVLERERFYQMSRYKDSFIRLESYVERFKALNATLHNSRRSFPVLIDTLLGELRKKDGAQSETYDVEKLLYDESFYLIKKDTVFFDDIQKDIDRVRLISLKHPELSTLVASVCRHAEIIANQQMQLNGLIEKITNPGYLENLDNIYDTYHKYSNVLHNIGQSYSFFVFSVSVMLLVLIALIGVRLLKVSRKIYFMNRNLEKRIQDRTKALEVEKERSSLILETTKEGIYGLDVEGRIVFANQSALDMTGHRADEILFECLCDIVQRKDGEEYHKERSHLYQSIVLGMENTVDDEVFFHKQQGLFPVEYTVSPILSEGKQLKGSVVVFRDITERKQIEFDLHDAKDRAEESTRLKSEFLANMSHEIRTPMNGVIGMTNLLLDTELTGIQRNYAKTAMNSAESLLHLVNDILDFSKIEAGKLELELIPFDLQILVEEVADIISVKARETGLEMLLRFAPDMPRYVVGDPGRVRQVLLNLASNALKFTEEGHVFISVDIESYKGGMCAFYVRVEDTGIGIPEDKLETIFSKFQQADGSTTRKFGGTGLGLAICKQLAEMMDGDIGVESCLGEGSQFWFRFKLPLDEDSKGAGSLDFTADLTGLRAILVDDNKVAQDIAAEQMRAKNMDVVIVSSGEEALTAMREASDKHTPYEMAVLDYMMPGMDGVELAKKIKADTMLRETSLLMVSSAPKRGDTDRMEDAGFSGFLTKPASGQDLIMALCAIQSIREGRSKQKIVTRHTLREAVAQRSDDDVDSFYASDAQILLVEDNATNQMVATAMLENVGCHVTPAGNGEEAVSLVKQRDFDLIFMDCNMPVMDGFESTKAIRSLKKWEEKGRTPIVAFTAFAMKGDDQKCFDAGMDDYMTKPIQKQVLMEMLRKWLPETCLAEKVEFAD